MSLWKSIIKLMKKLIANYLYQKEQFLRQFISVGQFMIFSLGKYKTAYC